MPAIGCAGGHPVREADVEGEQHGVRGGERDAERVVHEVHVGDEVDAGDGEQEGREVGAGADCTGGQRDHRQELDRGDGAQRQPVDREVEAGVHRREHRPPGHQQSAGVALEPRPGLPGPAPQREHHRRRGDPEPGDAQDVDPGEQQHRERGAEVVEHRADHEVRVRGTVPTRGRGLMVTALE